MPPLTEERRWATVLFADLSGFTTLSEQMDPEDVRAMVDGAMAKVGQVVDSYGGSVNAVMGDGLMALFGAPVAHGDDAERAVRAALEMQKYAAEQAEEFGGLPLRVGINTGEIMFAPVGPEGHRQMTAIGDVTNTAARLQSAAPQIGVLVGEETYRATRYTFRYEPVEPLELKGKQSPVKAWLAVEALDIPAGRPSRTAMIGREAELRELMGLWEKVTGNRRPHLVTIIGPPGIGKTRLSQEFANLLEASGAFRLSGRSLPYGERTGYGAFVEQLKKLAGIYETDSPDEAARKLAETLRDVFGGQGPDEVLGHLTALIGAGAADAVADQQSLFYSVRRFCEALAAKRPTLFVFEDIHWADETLLRLLRSLAERVREVPALFMTLARPELLRDRPEWGGGLPSYSALLLEPLSSDATRKLVMQLVGGEQAGAAARRVEVIAEGNPLFIEELAASVAEGTSDPGAELPTNLRSIIAARLDSLASDEKKLVLNASVVGKVFWRGVVAHLGVNGATDELLDLLEAKDFIRRERSSRFGDDSEFTFKHMLIREVAYSTLPKATRRKLHASVANFLEQASEKKSPEVGALLAHHYKEAGEAAKAVHYLLAVAGNARMAWAKGEAISAYEEALVLLSDSDPEKAIQIRLKKAETFVESADFQRAAAELTGLLDSLSGRDLLTAELALARSFYWMADVGRIEEHGRKAIELVESLGAEDLRGSALGVLCLSAGMNGEIARAVELGDEALRVWPSDGPEGDLSSFIGVTGLHRYWRGDFQSAVDLARRGYEIGSNVFHVEGLISNGAQLALALASQGKFEDALSVLSRVLERADELGPSVFASRAMVIGGGILRDTLDAAGARKMVEEGIEMGKQVGFPMSPVQGAIDLVFLDVLDGEPGRAQKAIPVLREQAENLKGFHQWLAGSRVAEAAAEAALAAGSFEEAANAATDSIERARRHGRAKYELAGKTVLGRALAAMNSLDEATRELKTAAELGRRLKSPQLLFPAVHALSAVLSQAGRDEEAAAAAGEAAAAVAAMEAGLPPSRREAFRSRATELIAAGLP